MTTTGRQGTNLIDQNQAPVTNFFGGGSDEGANAARSNLIDPSTGSVYATAPLSREREVTAATAAAREALPVWSGMTPGQRATQLLALADHIEAAADQFVALEAQCTGKSYSQIREIELPHIVDVFRFFAGAARSPQGIGAGEYIAGRESWIRREPAGVVAAILPWNFPLMMAAWKLGPALAAGCTAVVKPAETTPASSVLLAKVAGDILPPGVLNILCGDRTTGDLLVRDPIPAVIAFTGSTIAGRSIAAAAAADLKRVHLELGGNCPAVVLGDADIPGTARGLLTAGTFNAGQACAAPARIIAVDEVYEDLVAELVALAKDFRPGGPDEGAPFGPLNNADQLRRVQHYVQSARQGDGEIIAGGSQVDRPGYFFQATIIAGPAHSEPIACEEVFGPVLTVQRARSAEEALALANDTPYGLAASVWTENHGAALNAARALNFGEVWINCHLDQSPELPHTGFNQSGYGSDMSLIALENYTRVKAITSRL